MTKISHTTVIVVVCTIIILVLILGGTGLFLFRKKEKKSGIYSYKPPEKKTVRIIGSFLSEPYKDGRYGIIVASGPKVLNSSNPITSTTNSYIVAEIFEKEPLMIRVIDVNSGKNIPWMEWKAHIPPHKWKELDYETHDIYLTEGGPFTEKDMKPFTRIHFSPLFKGENIEFISLKMSYPNGQHPHTDNPKFEDNTIAYYVPHDQGGQNMIISGLPIHSELALVQVQKNGIKEIIDTFKITDTVDELYISPVKGVSLVN